MKSFMDLLKEDLINSKTIGNLTFEGVISAMLLAFIAGMIIYMVYKFSYSGVMFIHNFAITLVGLSMITCLIILTITSNLLLSLGMVGALSIVRFRTAIKEPIDMIYMFWSIAMGVTIGAGFFMLATVGMILISVVLYGLSRYSSTSDHFILVIRHGSLSLQDIENVLKKHSKSCRFRAQTTIGEKSEWTYEMRLKKDTSLLLVDLKTQLSIEDYSLVSYNTNTLM